MEIPSSLGSLNNNIKVLDASPDGRCLAISFTLNVKVVVMFNVYLPCLDSSPLYEANLDVREVVGYSSVIRWRRRRKGYNQRYWRKER